MNEELNKSQENIEKVRPKCLFIDDHREIVLSLKSFFNDSDNFIAVECHSVADAMNAIKANSPKVIFLDNSLTSGNNEGLEIAKLVKEMDPDIRIFSTTTNASLKLIYKKMGIDHIEKSDTDALQEVVSGE